MLKLVRYAEFITTPWKNGGGITHEALRKGPPGDAHGVGDFLWRVSVAQVDASGPFSNFAGYKRTLVLLQGDGVRLRFSDRTVTELREAGDLVTFDGALDAECQLLGGPCVDLNLMIAAGVSLTAAAVEPVAKEVRIDDAQASTVLVFCVDGSVAVEEAGAPPAVLERWDLAAVSRSATAAQAGTPTSLRLAPHAAGAAATVFIARLVD